MGIFIGQVSNSGKSKTDASAAIPDYWYVIPVAGQSNGMAYGEGLPLPETLDKPHPRIKQLARRATVTPNGEACKYNDIIPLDHCPHDVQDMSKINHPRADLTRGQYGTVAQTLHIAKKLLPYIPDDAGILIVPCCRGGAAFTRGADGAYNAATGATEASARWGVGKPLYQDLIARTKAALDANPKNQLLAVVWMQGEFDMSGAGYAKQPAMFVAMVKQFRADLSDHAGQCPDFNTNSVPWICGDTTYYWKNTYPAQYDAVYGAYRNSTEPGVHFVPFMTDATTNAPAEDPDIPSAGYYGAASRTAGTLVSSARASHFSSWARRGVISDRLATAILEYAGRTAGFISGMKARPEQPEQPVQPARPEQQDVPADNTVLSLRASDGLPDRQGWRVTGGTAVMVDSSEATGGRALEVKKQGKHTWYLSHAVDENTARALLARGGKLSVRFRVKGNAAKNRYAIGLYWRIPAGVLPQGVTMMDGNLANTYPNLLGLFVVSDGTNLNLMRHRKGANTKLGTFGKHDNNWHTMGMEFKGDNTLQFAAVIDGNRGNLVRLANCPSETELNVFSVTSITGNVTYSTEIDQVILEVNPVV
ncbi:sialate O-acetylesterase [Salmonella enterica]